MRRGGKDIGSPQLNTAIFKLSEAPVSSTKKMVRLLIHRKWQVTETLRRGFVLVFGMSRARPSHVKCLIFKILSPHEVQTIWPQAFTKSLLKRVRSFYTLFNLQSMIIGERIGTDTSYEHEQFSTSTLLKTDRKELS